jgi:hypothetical protein
MKGSSRRSAAEEQQLSLELFPAPSRQSLHVAGPAFFVSLIVSAEVEDGLTEALATRCVDCLQEIGNEAFADMLAYLVIPCQVQFICLPRAGLPVSSLVRRIKAKVPVSTNGRSLWEASFVSTPLSDHDAISKEMAFLRDRPQKMGLSKPGVAYPFQKTFSSAW